MSVVIRALGLVVLGGSLAALGLRPVPPGHVGVRGDARLAPGLRWAVEGLHPLDIEPVGPTIHGLNGTAPPIPVQRDGQRFELSGIRAPDSPIEQIQGAISRAGQVKGFETIAILRPPTEREAADAEHVGRIQARVAALGEAMARIEADRGAIARAHAESRARALRRAERRRDLRRVEADAQAARIRAEASLTREAIATAAEAEAARIVADGTLALARAEARRDALRAAALAQPGGAAHLAIEAARRFRFDPARLDPRHPGYFQATWGLAAWRAYFLGAHPP